MSNNKQLRLEMRLNNFLLNTLERARKAYSRERNNPKAYFDSRTYRMRRPRYSGK